MINITQFFNDGSSRTYQVQAAKYGFLVVKQDDVPMCIQNSDLLIVYTVETGETLVENANEGKQFFQAILESGIEITPFETTPLQQP